MNSYHDIEAQFEKLFDDNYRRLIFHALRFVDSQEEAEDIVSDVFYELWRNRDSIDWDSGILSYLFRAVSTRALNVLRHKNIAAVRIELLEAINEKRLEFISDDNTCRKVETGEIREGLLSAIKDLPERCREVFVLSYINGLKNKEIATAMNVSVRTVDAQIYKALRVLRDKLKYLLTLTGTFFYSRISDFLDLFV